MFILEPINGINGHPVLIANLNLDQGQVNQRKRLLQLAEGLSILKSLPCNNIIASRNYDYTASLFNEESEVIRGKGFKENF